ncbi:ATP-binding cassette domain-containing protein [Reinekea sp.]|jgi:ATPase subunit of ABC transporter with duplicated ATPase domains|uniref:ATP-binding cassette domain-containing protein n=1 Tax=Reinekea sp. TaxID=1970455 RepID=UPI00398A1D9E
MAKFLTLQNVSFLHNNGQTLFESIQFNLQYSFSAIVGANGAGKSVLSRLLANELKSHEGQVHSNASVYYVPQQWPYDPSASTSVVLGLATPLAAIKRIEAGSVSEQDFELAEPWWNWQETLKAARHSIQMVDELDLSKSISNYSGGEQFRVLWLAAILNSPDVYIFDEPTNHLDQKGRADFLDWVRNQAKPVIAVSHDRSLLNKVDGIYELTAKNLHHHAGNFDVFFRAQEDRWNSQQKILNDARKSQRHTAKKVQDAYEKQQQRSAHGMAKAAKENWSAIERGGIKETASAALGSQTRRDKHRKADTQINLSDAEQAKEWFEPIKFELPNSVVSPAKKILTLENFQVMLNNNGINKTYTANILGAQRIQLVGENGSGKSLLIKSIIGQWQAVQGHSHIHVPYCHLDQNFYHLDKNATAVELFQQAHPSFNQRDAHERLAWLRLRNDKANIPFGSLSGGEQLKTALAINLLGAITPNLLFLDEPSNHLDLDSLNALEQALRQYKGAIIIVSHDQYFMKTLALTHQWDVKTGELRIL